MAVIGELIAKITADTSGFRQKMTESTASFKNFAAIISKGALALAAVVATALVGAFTALAHIINDTTEAISQLVDESNKLGTSVQVLQKLNYAASLVGVSAGDVSAAIKKLGVNLSEATNGNEAMAKSFSDLGLSAQKLKSMSVDQQFIEISEAIKAVKNPADQMKAAMDLFGRSGVNVLGLLKDDLKAVTGEFEAFGGLLTNDQANAVDSYGDSVTKLGAVWEAFKTQLTVAVAPAFEYILNYIKDTIVEMGGVGPAARMAALFVIDSVTLMAQGIDGVYKSILNLKLIYLQFVDTVARNANVLQKALFIKSNAQFSEDSAAGVQRLEDIFALQNQIEQPSSIIQGLQGFRNQVANPNTGNKQNVTVTVAASSDFIVKVAGSDTIINAATSAAKNLAAEEARRVAR